MKKAVSASDTRGKSWLICSASKADIDVLATFSVALAEESEGKTLRVDVVGVSLTTVLDDSSIGQIFVAKDESKLIGYIMISGHEWSDWRNGMFLWLTGIYVCPEYRRQGVRAALYYHARDWARSLPMVLGIRAYIHESNKFTLISMQRTSYRIIEEIF